MILFITATGDEFVYNVSFLKRMVKRKGQKFWIVHFNDGTILDNVSQYIYI